MEADPRPPAAELSPSENLDADEEALRRGGASVRATVLNAPAVSLGVSQGPEAAAARRARALGIPVLVRASGGTGLLHEPGDLAWAVVLPRADPRAGRDYARAYARLGAAVAEFLRNDVPGADWRPSRGVSSTYCLLGERGSALEARGRVVGGAAQHLTPTHLLHHGVLSRTVDRAAISRLFDLAPEEAQRHLTSLEEEGVTTPAPALRDALERRLARWLSRTGP